MARIFVYDGKEHPDPDPGLNVEQVRERMADFYTELSGAKHTAIKRGEDTIYEFQKQVGTKGRQRQ